MNYAQARHPPPPKERKTPQPPPPPPPPPDHRMKETPPRKPPNRTFSATPSSIPRASPTRSPDGGGESGSPANPFNRRARRTRDGASTSRPAWQAARRPRRLGGGRQAVQIPVGNGASRIPDPVGILCDARLLSIFEGASEIPAQVIARRCWTGELSLRYCHTTDVLRI